MTTAAPDEWQGAGGLARGRRRPFFWRRVLWTLIYPQRGQRILPTLPGILLIAVSMGIGMAAYNSSNNILFITLSLLLACLILSGVLSWLNFKGVVWRVQALSPWRAGQDQLVTLELRNAKRFLPTYALWFELKMDETVAQLDLRDRIDPAGETRLDWTVRPARRGLARIELTGVGSLFPFGFLKKTIRCDQETEVMVWPASIEYRRLAHRTQTQARLGERVARVGHSGDLLALRNYTPGDSHRSIHWKATARLRRLMVRQFTTEQQEELSLRLPIETTMWTRAEQFETLCRFAATLAEDLFRAGRLGEAGVEGRALRTMKRVGDLEAFLDELAQIQPAVSAPVSYSTREGTRGRPILTFIPDGARGVLALIDGEPAAAA